MVSHWCSTEGKSLKDSFVAEMINAKIAIDFSLKASDIIRKKYPRLSDRESWDSNDVEQIRHFNNDMECGVNMYVTLKGLYQKEFNDFDEVEARIKATASIASDDMLVKFGWVKEEAKCF